MPAALPTMKPHTPWGNLTATHYWDCNGQGCDASLLQPWDASKYTSPIWYQPQNPSDYGGSSRWGERLWLTAAASDQVADLLGPSDGCCGSDEHSSGCGKCLMVSCPSALEPSWLAIVMKKNRCPPHSSGCSKPNLHIDIAVPGFDWFHASTAKICGKRPGTGGWHTQPAGGSPLHASYALGGWFVRYNNTKAAASLCSELPVAFQSGCKLFAAWGWTSGNPQLLYKAVACPSAFTTRMKAIGMQLTRHKPSLFEKRDSRVRFRANNY